MTPTPQRFAHLTKQLVTACGGQDDAARALVEAGLRASHDGALAAVKKASSPNQPEVLKITEAACLEEYCGQPIITRELAERFARPSGGDLMTSGVELVREASDLPSVILKALADDGDISPAELVQIKKETDQARRRLDEVDAAIVAIERRHARAAGPQTD